MTSWKSYLRAEKRLLKSFDEAMKKAAALKSAMRTTFETWATSRGLDIECWNARDEKHVRYYNEITQRAWLAYCAGWKSRESQSATEGQ